MVSVLASLLSLSLMAPMSLGGEVEARIFADPAEVKIGEPFDWVLFVEHPSEVRVDFVDESPLPDDTWVLVEGRRLGGEHPADADRRVTVFRWTVFSLEPGLRELQGLELRYDQDGAPRKALAPPGSVHVIGELAAEEDAPRPPLGFRPPSEPETAADGRARAFTILLVLFGLFPVILWLRRRRARTGEPAKSGPTPRERLSALHGASRETPEQVREFYFELSSGLREHVEHKLAVVAKSTENGDEFARPGATDEEWGAELRRSGRVSSELGAALEELLERGTPVKYGRTELTRFAVDETLQELDRCLVLLDGSGAEGSLGNGGGKR